MMRKAVHKKTVRKKPATQKSGVASVFSVQGGPDRILFGLIFLIVIFGLLMVASAGVIYGNARFEDPYFFFKQQFVGVILGFAALFVLQKVDYHIFRKISFFGYIGALILLVAVLVSASGVSAYGAQRWISLGSITIQPAEGVKLAMILYIAAWCAGKGVRQIRDFIEGFVPFIIILGVPCFLLILQPDVGTTGMVVIISMMIFFLAGARMQHIATMIVGGIMMLAILIGSSQYRLARFTTFLSPDSDVLGASYQIKQALIAVGSGGLWGRGLGLSHQKGLYLPEPVGDSIFAIIAEELGLIGSTLLMLAFIVMAWRIFRVARNAPDMFGRLIAGGVGVWVIGQAMMNIAAITGLIPLTGITLSLISFGGTSMVFMLAGLGIVLNISRQSQKSP